MQGEKADSEDWEYRYHEYFENFPAALYKSTPGGKFLEINKAFYNLFGFKKKTDVTLKGAHQFYVRAQDRKKWTKLMNSRGLVNNFKVQCYLHSGNKIWIKDYARTVRDKSGNILYYEGYIEDINKQVKYENALKETLSKLRKSFGGTIQIITALVEQRDPYTAGHQRSVADLARAIGKQMGISKNTIDGIRMAGSVHDLGKMSIPAEILSHPGKLNKIEMTLVQNHPKTGYNILKDIKFPWPVAKIVLQHHERMDGSGYPQGMKGEDILLEARILAVADVVEAMDSHRPYRPALGIEAALKEIEENKGRLYDPAAVDACVKLFREKNYKFKTQ